MEANTLFYILIGLLAFDFIKNKWLGALNAKHFKDAIPESLNDVYDQDDYEKSQLYKLENYRFGLISSTCSFIATLAFFFLDGFLFVDNLARQFSDNTTIIALVFFGIIMLASDILSTPFAYYRTFVIEEKFGFNKTTLGTFITDKIKGWALGIIFGGSILAAIITFFELTGTNFWIYAWILVIVFSVFTNMFYSKLIVPLFNKQTPLEEGTLRDSISQYASTVGFELDNIFVIDGSKRSAKANAYFSGFGAQKRVTLYDTLINDLEEEEIVAVLAHEVGHYKKKHIIYNLMASILLTGFTLWLLSLFINNPIFSEALGIQKPSFHIGLITFGILYSPISEFTGIIMNIISRKFEYQADDYAATTYKPEALISSLKKLNKNSLSNLTPHKWYVWYHYSHPTLKDRVQNLSKQ